VYRQELRAQGRGRGKGKGQGIVVGEVQGEGHRAGDI
jgi:hypothetical protein